MKKRTPYGWAYNFDVIYKRFAHKWRFNPVVED